MSKRRIQFVSLIAVLVFVLVGCTKNEAEENLIFTTGTTTGVFYSLGAVLSTIWGNELDQRVTSQASNGSVENLKLMQKGEANIGFTTVNIAYEAYNGENSFNEKAYSDVRILGNLYPNVSHFVTLNNGKVNSIEDIAGKSFVYGAAGSATEIESNLVLDAHGVDKSTVKANYVGFTEAVDLIRNGQVDVVNIYSGVPSAATTELITTFDSKVLNFSDEAIEKMTKQYPWNFKYEIKANTYDKQTEPIITVGQYSAIVVDAGLSDETVYELTKILWESLEEIEQGHSIASQFDPAVAVEGTAGIPIHPGAEKYYKEKGFLK
ncbi:TAXI family TRAP transporter solute-binding subunit [Solibacillus sp. CAU 1738]|uniref:TAXI family TRAP transporter solute-binding subunit n=1 Tax=Solibacillus sp. CAU 1738 TaxID=3140363 RepID=UPI003261565D